MKRKEMAKWYRKADIRQFRKRLQEISLEIAKFKGVSVGSEGEGMIRLKTGARGGIDSGYYHNLKRERAVLLTIVKERGFKL